MTVGFWHLVAPEPRGSSWKDPDSEGLAWRSLATSWLVLPPTCEHSRQEGRPGFILIHDLLPPPPPLPGCLQYFWQNNGSGRRGGPAAGLAQVWRIWGLAGGVRSVEAGEGGCSCLHSHPFSFWLVEGVLRGPRSFLKTANRLNSPLEPARLTSGPTDGKVKARAALPGLTQQPK